ncbi:MAG TPA: histidine--tRNA ligase, partial [Caldithrix sp.]|nr:histidine--tRNA ligase [Caldithrix sp.]
GINEMRELMKYAQLYEIPVENLLFDLTLARGLDYYTGPIFETIVEEPQIGSITGGGRYDRLIGLFSGQEQPATGSSIGLERIITVMDELHMFPDYLKTPVQVLVTVFDSDSIAYSIKVATLLRKAGINADIYTGKSKLRGQFGLANDKGIPLIIIAGSDEIESASVSLKDLRTGEQQTLPLNDLPETVKSLRGK